MYAKRQEFIFPCRRFSIDKQDGRPVVNMCFRVVRNRHAFRLNCGSIGRTFAAEKPSFTSYSDRAGESEMHGEMPRFWGAKNNTRSHSTKCEVTVTVMDFVSNYSHRHVPYY